MRAAVSAIVLASVMLLLGACTPAEDPVTQSSPEPPPPVAVDRPAKAEPVVPVPSVIPEPSVIPDPSAAPDPRACVRDDDCMASCAHGAVARAWHVVAYPGEEGCEGGCTSLGTEPPRCEAGACVAYREGAFDPSCTGVDRPVATQPGPAHFCSVDADCTQTCAFGAVNRGWLASKDAAPDCRDGCTRKGTESPRCESGRCVAYHLGRRDELCTTRSVR